MTGVARPGGEMSENRWAGVTEGIGMAEPLRVLVADDQDLVCASFRLLVDSAPDMVAVGGALDGAQAVALAHAERPDIVLMDVRMPGTDGIEATRAITGPDGVPGARVLILTTFDLDEYVYAALEAGASGFLLKNSPPEDLLRAVRVVAEGEALLAPSVTRRLVERFTRGARPAEAPRAALEGVTEREREVLELIARGLSNDEIAARLQRSRATVKTHVGALLHKLGARDRAQLVVAAYEAGLVVPGRIGPG